jgi:GDPmannose 4,6-dehydratase
MKKAIITGITGQDGSYLSELLIQKGYEVHRIVKKETLNNIEKIDNIKNIKNSVFFHESDFPAR